MIKKIVLVFAVLVCLFSLNTMALQVDSDFYVYGQNNKELCDTIGMSEGELNEYCQTNNITFLAVDKDNQRQIRKTETKDAFSKKIGNFFALKDDEILELTEELTGFKNVKGAVLEKGNKKYLKVELKTTDSGGEYYLTQYLTVTDSKKEILSFYTNVNENTDYIENVFSSQFKTSSSVSVLKIISAIGIVLFSVLAVTVIVLIVKDTFDELSN